MSAPERIVTDRLVGRRIRSSDLSYVVETDSDAAMQATLSGNVQGFEESKARLHRWLVVWERHGFGFWVFNDGIRDVGHGGLFPSPRDPGSIEVGYALKPPYWNMGYATEMAAAVLRIAFEIVGLPNVVAIALASNRASLRVMEKIGLRYEREFVYPDERIGVFYTIDRESWLKSAGPPTTPY